MIGSLGLADGGGLAVLDLIERLALSISELLRAMEWDSLQPTFWKDSARLDPWP